MPALSAAYGTASVILSNLFVKLPIPTQTSDFSNQVIIVTGANTGLGYESSVHLSRLGVGKVIMAVRTLAKGESAKKAIIKTTGRLDSSIEVWPIDMDSYDSIKAFAARASELPRLDGVLANAGIMTTNFGLSQANEKTLTVNVISTFLLYLLLLPAMRESGTRTGNPCRFVIPNSALHYMTPLAELDPNQTSIIERLNNPDKADMTGRYPISKLLVIYTVRELAQRVSVTEKGLCILNTPNPSFCKSGLAHETQDSRVFKISESLLARSTEEGSRALVHGLFAGPESNGQYLTNCHVEAPACHVTNKWGQQVQKKFVDELLQRLDKIQPGILSVI